MSERLSKAGCDLVSLFEKIDTASAAGKMVFEIVAVQFGSQGSLPHESPDFSAECDLFSELFLTTSVSAC